MGRRGPRPVPTLQLAARGSWRAKKRKGEPEPTVGLPDAPAWLSDAGRAAYTDVLKAVGDAGTATRADGMVAGLLAEAVSVLRVARAAMQDEGLGCTGGNGQPAVSPASKVFVEAWAMCLKASREFGLSPAARVGLTTTGDGKKLDSCFAM